MVVVLNGVLADECPTSVRALLASHPGYRDAAAQLLAAAARQVPPPGLLYVGQRELAAAVPHDSECTHDKEAEPTASHCSLGLHSLRRKAKTSVPKD